MKITAVLLLLFANLSLGNVASDSSTWEGRYECDTLPTVAGWTQSTAGFCSTSGGILTVDSLDTNCAPYWYRSVNVDFSTGFTMEWRVKYIDGSSISSAPCSIGACNNHTAFAMQGIKIGTADVMGVGTAVNTQNDFHVYRMMVKDGYATLYIDNSVTPATVQPILAGDFGGWMIRFGDVTGTEDAEYQIDYVRWTTAGAFSPLPPPSVSADSSTWGGKYECDTLPTVAGWTESNAGFCSTSGGILTVDSLDTDSAPYWYRSDLNVDFSTGFTMEWKVKFINGGIISSSPCSIGVSNNHTAFAMQGIKIGNADVMGSGVVMTTQDSFHVYRMTVKNGYATLYIDNDVVPAKIQPIWVGDFGASMIRFGDVTGAEDAEYQIDYVRWTTAGAFAPCRQRDLIVDIDFYDQIFCGMYDSQVLSAQQVRDMADNMAANGVGTIIFRTTCGGMPLYQTKLNRYPRQFDEQEVRDVWNDYPYLSQTEGDMNKYITERKASVDIINSILAQYNPPKVLIDQAHALGLKVIIWIDIFDDWIPGFGNDLLKNKPYLQWTSRNQQTFFKGVMSYAWPEARTYRIEQVKELLALGADGIHFSTSGHSRHLITASTDAFGYEMPIVKEYKRRYGIDILSSTNWDQEKWHNIKGDYMTGLYTEIASICHKQGKEFWIGLPLGDYHNMSCSPYWSNNIPARYKQDWRKWVDNGVADAFIVGDYEVVSRPTDCPDYWAAKGLGSYTDLFEWSANTYRTYCRNKTKLYLFGEWLPSTRDQMQMQIDQFKNRVLTYGFDGVDFHEYMNFGGNYDLLVPISAAFNCPAN